MTIALTAVGVGLLGAGVAVVKVGDREPDQETRGTFAVAGYSIAGTGIAALLVIPFYLASSSR